ncbi:hypothetical protein HYH03_012141 [Edaphochlamys debaryana]|uniref:Uncharacterized protein n=1 Tax=Edaphochlamys debaryana TaxID=47281 RepID=A0A836BVS0_9CHLO|nr:hypothetical protein HYH03_012141 [Edaphochlamys debaryana]|eukprot:KAG2489309.1 hypothetical protein HYH03_012141 [Edaphochlamys debaryana]
MSRHRRSNKAPGAAASPLLSRHGIDDSEDNEKENRNGPKRLRRLMLEDDVDDGPGSKSRSGAREEAGAGTSPRKVRGSRPREQLRGLTLADLREEARRRLEGVPKGGQGYYGPAEEEVDTEAGEEGPKMDEYDMDDSFIHDGSTQMASGPTQSEEEILPTPSDNGTAQIPCAPNLEFAEAAGRAECNAQTFRRYLRHMAGGVLRLSCRRSPATDAAKQTWAQSSVWTEEDRGLLKANPVLSIEGCTAHDFFVRRGGGIPECEGTCTLCRRQREYLADMRLEGGDAGAGGSLLLGSECFQRAVLYHAAVHMEPRLVAFLTVVAKAELNKQRAYSGLPPGCTLAPEVRRKALAAVMRSPLLRTTAYRAFRCLVREARKLTLSDHRKPGERHEPAQAVVAAMHELHRTGWEAPITGLPVEAEGGGASGGEETEDWDEEERDEEESEEEEDEDEDEGYDADEGRFGGRAGPSAPGGRGAEAGGRAPAAPAAAQRLAPAVNGGPSRQHGPSAPPLPPSGPHGHTPQGRGGPPEGQQRHQHGQPPAPVVGAATTASRLVGGAPCRPSPAPPAQAAGVDGSGGSGVAGGGSWGAGAAGGGGWGAGGAGGGGSGGAGGGGWGAGGGAGGSSGGAPQYGWAPMASPTQPQPPGQGPHGQGAVGPGSGPGGGGVLYRSSAAVAATAGLTVAASTARPYAPAPAPSAAAAATAGAMGPGVNGVSYRSSAAAAAAAAAAGVAGPNADAASCAPFTRRRRRHGSCCRVGADNHARPGTAGAWGPTPGTAGPQ